MSFSVLPVTSAGAAEESEVWINNSGEWYWMGYSGYYSPSNSVDSCGVFTITINDRLMVLITNDVYKLLFLTELGQQP